MPLADYHSARIHSTSPCSMPGEAGVRNTGPRQGTNWPLELGAPKLEVPANFKGEFRNHSRMLRIFSWASFGLGFIMTRRSIIYPDVCLRRRPSCSGRCCSCAQEGCANAATTVHGRATKKKICCSIPSALATSPIPLISTLNFSNSRNSLINSKRYLSPAILLNFPGQKLSGVNAQLVPNYISIYT